MFFAAACHLSLLLYVAPSGVIPVLTFLRDHGRCQLKACMDTSGADYPEDKRFEVVYPRALSVKFVSQIRMKTYMGETDPVLSAATALYCEHCSRSRAHWMEALLTPEYVLNATYLNELSTSPALTLILSGHPVAMYRDDPNIFRYFALCPPPQVLLQLASGAHSTLSLRRTVA